MLLGSGELRSDAPAPVAIPESPPPIRPVKAKGATVEEEEEEEEIGCCEPEGSCGFCACGPAPGTWRAALSDFANSSLIGNISTGLVVVNVVIMCMGYEGMRLPS